MRRRPDRTAQQDSSSFVLDERDIPFLARPELRPVRLQLELLKPDLLMREQGIIGTIVVFGSARVPAPEDAARYLADAEAAAGAQPGDAAAQQKLAAAKRLATYSGWYDEARKFAATVSQSCQVGRQCDYVMITGGGPGIMEAANRGADDVGAKSIGLNIMLPFEQQPNPYIHPDLCFDFHYFAMRKMHFLMRARALVFFPGGFGTLDEMFESLTLMQTRKISPMPCVLVCRAYWEKLLDFDFLVQEGMIAAADLSLFTYAETADGAWAAIQNWYADHPEGPRG